MALAKDRKVLLLQDKQVPISPDGKVRSGLAIVGVSCISMSPKPVSSQIDDTADADAHQENSPPSTQR
jgi:hypothetical protein